MHAFIDSHVHLDDRKFDADRGDVMTRARAAGITALLNPADDYQSLLPIKQLAGEFEELYFAWGIHPGNIDTFTPEVIDLIMAERDNPKFKAIGEVGLDFYWRQDNAKEQEQVFERFFGLALNLKLPLIIHSRNANQRMREMIRRHCGGTRLFGVWHCFSGDQPTAAAALDAGFMLGFCGNITYPSSAELASVAATVPLDRLLLETDSPYLTPLTNRGRRNEPAFIVELYEFMARRRGIDLDLLKRNVYDNFTTLFNLGPRAVA